MLTCEEIPLLELARQEPGLPLSNRVLDHVESCSTCQERLEILGLIQQARTRSRPLRRLSLLARVAAAALLALPLLYPWINREREEPWAQLAERQEYPYFPLKTRSRRAPQAGQLKAAFEAYLDRHFREAEGLFARVPADGEVLFYRGVCRYMEGDYPGALQMLEQSSLDPLWRAPSLWYLSSCQLRLGLPRRAARALEELLETGSDRYQKAALAILRQIEGERR